MAALNRAVDLMFGGLASLPGSAVMRFQVQLWGEGTTNPEVLESMNAVKQTILAYLSDIVRGGQDSGEFALGADPENVARVLMSSYDGLILQKALDNDIDVRSYVAALRSVMYGYLPGQTHLGR